MTTLLEVDHGALTGTMVPLYARRTIEVPDLEFISTRRALLHAGHTILVSGLTESGCFFVYLVPVDLT